MMHSMKTANQYVQDASAELAVILQMIKEIKFEIVFQWRKGYRTLATTWQEDPRAHIIRICYRKAEYVRVTNIANGIPTNIKYNGLYAINIIILCIAKQ